MTKKKKTTELQAISEKSVVKAALKVKYLTLPEIDQLSSLLMKTQPDLFKLIAGLELDGVTQEHSGHVWYLLYVCYYACEGEKFPMLTAEEDISEAFRAVGKWTQYFENEKDKKVFEKMLIPFPEATLLAYVIGHLDEQGITGKTESEYQTLITCFALVQLFHLARKKRLRLCLGE